MRKLAGGEKRRLQNPIFLKGFSCFAARIPKVSNCDLTLTARQWLIPAVTEPKLRRRCGMLQMR
jgi:hypothetical protein